VTESAFGGSLESGGRFRVSALGTNLASVPVKALSHFIFFSIFKKFCTFNAICNVNVAMKYFTVEHKKVHFRPI
jgi:hypothetical protein